jgi:hypothetical protein
MTITDDMVLWVDWLLVAEVLCHVALHFVHQLTPESRGRRKRRRNYGKVIARNRRPMVTLSVRTPGK